MSQKSYFNLTSKVKNFKRFFVCWFWSNKNFHCNLPTHFLEKIICMCNNCTILINIFSIVTSLVMFTNNKVYKKKNQKHDICMLKIQWIFDGLHWLQIFYKGKEFCTWSKIHLKPEVQFFMFETHIFKFYLLFLILIITNE